MHLKTDDSSTILQYGGPDLLELFENITRVQVQFFETV